MIMIINPIVQTLILNSWVPDDCIATQPSKDFYMVEIPCKDMSDPARKRVSTMRVPMILPHELLNFLTVSLLNMIIKVCSSNFIS